MAMPYTDAVYNHRAHRLKFAHVPMSSTGTHPHTKSLFGLQITINLFISPQNDPFLLMLYIVII